MRELSREETVRVSGGPIPAVAVGIGISAVTGAITGYKKGGWQGAAVGAVIGTAATGAGAIAAFTSGFVRLGWSIRSVGIGASSGIGTSFN